MINELIIELKTITEKYKKLKNSLNEEEDFTGILMNLKESSENKPYSNEIKSIVEKYKESIPTSKLKFLVSFYNRNYTYGANSESDIDDFQFLIGNQNH
jgi:hypothetical protein